MFEARPSLVQFSSCPCATIANKKLFIQSDLVVSVTCLHVPDGHDAPCLGLNLVSEYVFKCRHGRVRPRYFRWRRDAVERRHRSGPQAG